MRKKNIYNHALKHPDYVAMVHDANAGNMTRPQIARKYKTSEAHVISIFGSMRKDGVEVRRFSWDNKREQMRLAIKTLKVEQKAQREKEMSEAARQLKLEQGGGAGKAGEGGAGGSGDPSKNSGGGGSGYQSPDMAHAEIETSYDERKDSINKVP
jgi:hypothetical protein